MGDRNSPQPLFYQNVVALRDMGPDTLVTTVPQCHASSVTESHSYPTGLPSIPFGL